MNSLLQPGLTIARFEASEIDPDRFDHEAHVHVGWLYVMAYPPKEAFTRFDAALRRLTEKIGANGKYSAVITWLFMLLIAERARNGEDWITFLARNRDLIDEWPGYRPA